MYDIAVVMDADNVTVPGFLSEVNRAYSAGVQAMQAHRTGKNLNTDIALLDGVSEEINNGFFRSGHNALGLSAGLAGSGMAFDYFWYYDAVQSLETAGEDKELELTLLECGMHTVYLENLPVYDEKTQKKRISNGIFIRTIWTIRKRVQDSLPEIVTVLQKQEKKRLRNYLKEHKKRIL